MKKQFTPSDLTPAQLQQNAVLLADAVTAFYSNDMRLLEVLNGAKGLSEAETNAVWAWAANINMIINKGEKLQDAILTGSANKH